jgi:hypothetical protein
MKSHKHRANGGGGKHKTEHQEKSIDKIWTKIPSQKINKLGGIKNVRCE